MLRALFLNQRSNRKQAKVGGSTANREYSIEFERAAVQKAMNIYMSSD